ncbi:MAG: exosortase-associated EpsI family protein [Planctomycetota bacterium]|jgi:hypothetical protein
MRGFAVKSSMLFALALGVLLLISAGIAYRIPAKSIRLLGQEPIPLPTPLSEFAMKVGDWKGQVREMASTTDDYMRDHFADDYFSRVYENTVTNAWASVYVVYCSTRPGGILGHRPRVCYLSMGWQHESTEKVPYTSPRGRSIEYLLHRFYKAPPDYDRTTVVSFYVVNGRVTSSEKDFSGPLGRRPNIDKDPSRYVAQIQISSSVQKSIEAALDGMVDDILDFLPGAGNEDSAGNPDRAVGGDIEKDGG